jgi:hypothetical protein
MQEYQIADVFTLYMKPKAGGYHGHYDNHRSGMRNTFSAPGMSKKEIITRFWDRAKEYQKSS